MLPPEIDASFILKSPEALCRIWRRIDNRDVAGDEISYQSARNRPRRQADMAMSKSVNHILAAGCRPQHRAAIGG
jgi:hypothetical protein